MPQLVTALFVVLASPGLPTGASVRPAEARDTWLELEIAIREGDPEAVKGLTAGGFDLDGFDPLDLWEQTPVLLAVKYRQPEILALLLEAGADPDRQDASGKSPLVMGVKGGALPIVRMLLERGANPDAGDSDDKTPLFWAIVGEDPGMVETLLRAGADPNAPWVHPFTGERKSLLWAARERANSESKTEILRLLEHYGAGDAKGGE